MRRSAGTLQVRRVAQPWPADREFRILSIDGGGIRGILPAAFLAGIERQHLADGNVADCFDLIAGTSTGGILALGLASGRTARDMYELYMERGGEIFPDFPWWRKPLVAGKHVLFTRCDRSALDRLIDETLNDRQIWQATKRLCIPSIDANYGEVFVFKTPHHPDYRKDWREPMAKAAKATSAAQSFFRPITDDTYTYLDGGIWANNPSMIGLVEALSAFDVQRHNVRLLSLGCVESTYRISWWHRKLGGWSLWTKNVIDGAMHLQSMNATGQSGLLIGRERLQRVDYPAITPRLELHDWARCRRILPAKADELVAIHGARVATEFLYDAADLYVPIYTPDTPPA